MQRRNFLTGSAIIGASIIIPSVLRSAAMAASRSERRVLQIIKAQRSSIGSLPLLRSFAGDDTDHVSPYVVFDEFGPVDLAPKVPMKVGAHPHAGIIPMTYFLSGTGHHRDSLDHDYQYGKNDFLIFTSGRGAIHMEETGQKVFDEGGIYHGFQIWLNLPARFKFVAPSTVMYHEEHMGFVKTSQYSVKVVLGEGFGVRSRVEMLFPVFYYHITLSANTKMEIPVDPTHNAFIYVVDGELEVQGAQQIPKNQMVIYERGGDFINVYSKEKTEILVLGGQPNNEPVYSYGPFVMNSKKEIEQCIADFNAGKMGNPARVDGV